MHGLKCLDISNKLFQVLVNLYHIYGFPFYHCRYFNNFTEPDYARSGNIATQTVIIDKGPLRSFSHSMEPQLRQLGLPTSLKKGIFSSPVGSLCHTPGQLYSYLTILT